MRERLTTLSELAGFACLSVSGFHVGEAVGYAVTGLCLIAVGFLAGRG
jgi:hypothetical protein